jgi:hypothetical protein
VRPQHGHWFEIAVYLATDELDDDEVEALADPDAGGRTLSPSDPEWEDIARALLERSAKSSDQLANEIRARMATARSAGEIRDSERDEKVIERAAAALIDEGPLEKCSLIRARLGRELERAVAHYLTMQMLNS